MWPILFLAVLTGDPGGEKIYSGKAEGAKNPATIRARDVFLKIEEYKKIIDKGLTDKDPEYFVLLAEANRKFNAAVSKTAADQKYDCIAEEGTVSFKGADATALVICSLQSP